LRKVNESTGEIQRDRDACAASAFRIDGIGAWLAFKPKRAASDQPS
jgi:hypothetical protein